MPFAVFLTTPRAGFPGVVTPYTVELDTLFPTRAEAEAFAATRPLSPETRALLDAMPSAYQPWQAGTQAAPISYPAGTFIAHAGFTWRCRVGHTAAGDPNFAPGIALNLWDKVQPPGTVAWDFPVRYEMPGQAIEGATVYDVRQPHTSQAGQNPSAAPALWLAAGPASAVVPYPRATWWVVGTTEPDYANVIRGKVA